MLSPAPERCLPSIILMKPSRVMRPRPTSTNVPTTALTMLRRNRLAVITKCHWYSPSLTQRASVTLHSVVLLHEHGRRTVHEVEVEGIRQLT